MQEARSSKMQTIGGSGDLARKWSAVDGGLGFRENRVVGVRKEIWGEI